MSLLQPSAVTAKDELFVKDLYFGSKGGTLQELSPHELHAAEKLFLRMLKGDRTPAVATEWAQLGMRMILASHDERVFTVVMEKENHKLGRGFFVFPEKGKQPIGLFVPHRFTDEVTGRIGLSLALENSFTVTAWNTVKRRGGGEPPYYWDLGKRRGSYFIALTKAFASVMPQGFHVQIHGFVNEKRKTEAARHCAAILSGGVQDPSVQIVGLRRCFQEKDLGKILVYPTDVKELGATKNVSGIVLREMGNRGFVHIEMNVELRKRLNDDPVMRRGFAECLKSVLR